MRFILSQNKIRSFSTSGLNEQIKVRSNSQNPEIAQILNLICPRYITGCMINKLDIKYHRHISLSFIDIYPYHGKSAIILLKFCHVLKRPKVIELDIPWHALVVAYLFCALEIQMVCSGKSRGQ